ncbi:hypothetical protein JQ636_22645 [Bradyrhizobium japonicum]|uniref:hypothetical protein n=1 Tax=Bradyrhizobium japonicum TaxID=375 RepID=UPI0012FD9537|nr:hypothetical protein [Bradyrhizobium japonicum]MBR0734368.1 hypothetical protein [Bradyrhizobium japonicum]MBR0806359.1 hypothetical protein [Bradyrhizobium japonicum]MBR0915300.1 hypothetical protein [Bradyrhizobium japonicum]
MLDTSDRASTLSSLAVALSRRRRPTSRREPCRNAPVKSLTAAIGWQTYALTGCAYSLGLAGLDHRADGDGRHTISGIVRVALVRLGEFESGMTAALLGAIPAVVLDGVGTTDVGRSLS